MSILSFLFPSDPKSQAKWNQGQLEALVDLLYLAIFADNHLSQLEEMAVKDELQMVEWKGDKSIDLYVHEAITRARDARSNPDYKADYLKEISNRLANEETRAQALEALEKVLVSDGSGEREKAFLRDVKVAFGA